MGLTLLLDFMPSHIYFNNAIVNLSLCLNETFKEDTDIFTYVRKL